MSYNLQSRNNALNLNPSTLNGVTADISSTVRGSDVYFAISAIMGTTAIVILALSAMKPRQDRIFFYMTAALNATACIAYFTMGSNLGFAPIGVEFMRSNPKVAGMYRQVFYARYIDWVVTTPLLLMDLMLTAALPWPTILWTIFLDEVMIITGLIGALVQSRYKFGKPLTIHIDPRDRNPNDPSRLLCHRYCCHVRRILRARNQWSQAR